MDITPSERMVTAAARELRDGEVVFVGIGLPNLACNLARRTHAPGLVLIYESGAIGAQPDRVPVSIGDPALAAGALGLAPMAEVFGSYLQGGRIDVGFLQGAQIDRFGNLNTTVIGEYAHPKVRLPGSGGACEIAIHARRVVVVAPQSRRSFPERLDFRTSPGHLDGRGGRARLGFPGEGPAAVVTQLATYVFIEGEMALATLHPGVTLAEARAQMGWEPRLLEPIGATPPPTIDELRLLREELDPDRLFSSVRP